MSLREMGHAVYMDDEAPGAWPNGSRVVKTLLLDPVETTAVGTKGSVLGSLSMPSDAIEEQRERGLDDVRYGYWVEWDDRPGLPVFCIDKKLSLIQ